MPIEKLRQLIGWMTQAGLAQVELSSADFHLRLRRSPGSAPVTAQVTAEPIIQPEQACITALGCGHFHARHPARDTPEVTPGQVIRAGDVIGVLAVGTLLLPVTAQQDGIAGEYLVTDGQLVDYAKPVLALTATGA